MSYSQPKQIKLPTIRTLKHQHAYVIKHASYCLTVYDMKQNCGNVHALTLLCYPMSIEHAQMWRGIITFNFKFELYLWWLVCSRKLEVGTVNSLTLYFHSYKMSTDTLINSMSSQGNKEKTNHLVWLLTEKPLLFCKAFASVFPCALHS